MDPRLREDDDGDGLAAERGRRSDQPADSRGTPNENGRSIAPAVPYHPTTWPQALAKLSRNMRFSSATTASPGSPACSAALMRFEAASWNAM